MDFTVMYEYRI